MLEVISPELAIAGKRDPKTPNRATVAWSLQARPSVGLRGADLYGARASYSQDDLPFGLT